MRFAVVILLLLRISVSLQAQQFQDITPVSGLPASFTPNVVLGDVDNDGDPDIITTGYDYTAVIFNDNLVFTRVQYYNEYPGETQVYFQNLDIGDFNLDGKLDILQTGGPNRRVFYILQNENNSFSNIFQDNYGLAGSSAFGDFDQDGDLDILYSGADQFSNQGGAIYMNNKAKLEGSSYYLPNGTTLFTSWLDSDHDGMLEVIQTVGGGYYFNSNYLLDPSIEQDEFNSKQIAIDVPLYGVLIADHDHDGDFDLLVKDAEWKFRIYDYENGDFKDTGIRFPQSMAAVWADMNNDGHPDVVLSGVEETFWNFETRIYAGDGEGNYSLLSNTGLPGTEHSRVAVGDLDNDGDLDLVMVGMYWSSELYTNKIFLNTINQSVTNQAPAQVTGLNETVNQTSVKFEWNASTDDKTPSTSLTYNVSVRKEDGSIIMPSHSEDDGKRMLFKHGNAYNNTTFTLNCLQEGTYYWSVQAIDASLQGSTFANNRTFTISNVAPSAPSEVIAKAVSDITIVLSWKDNTNRETEYLIYRAEPGNTFSDYYLIATLPPNSITYTDEGLLPDTEYVYRIVASNCAYPDDFSGTSSATTFPRAFVPTDWFKPGNSKLKFAALADYDNDKDLDLLVNYTIDYNNSITKLLKFDGSGFSDSGIIMPNSNAEHMRATWIDLNTDGYLDLFIENTQSFTFDFHLLINHKGESFSEQNLTINMPLRYLWQGGISWVDYDNDGDEDMLAQGLPLTGSPHVLRLFENKGNYVFQDTNLTLPGFIKSSRPWGDYDNDGDSDILVINTISCGTYSLAILENTGDKSFISKSLGLAALNEDLLNFSGDLKWGDYNNDGWLDIILSGSNTCGNGQGITRIYRNTGNRSFTAINTESMARLIYDVTVNWGDFDNDGDRDVLQYGNPFVEPFMNYTRIYSNNGNNVFAESSINYLPPSTQYGSASFGDIDNDGDLDLIIGGSEGYTGIKTTVYTSTIVDGWNQFNGSPSAPVNLKSVVANNTVELSWNESTDDKTPIAGLTYQYYLIHQTDTLVSSYSHSDGTRKVVRDGNAYHNRKIRLNSLEPGQYVWSVQAIDAGYRGSAFATEQTFEIKEEVITNIPESMTTEISLFPNPVTHSSFQLKITNNYSGPVELELSDGLGRAQHFSMTKESIDFVQSISSEGLSSGIYVVSLFMGEKIIRKKLIIP